MPVKKISELPDGSPALGTDKVPVDRSDNVSTVRVLASDIAKSGPPATHPHSESDITGLATDLSLKEDKANKNVANGYAGLSGSVKLNGTQQLYGAAANTACEGNDARLTNARTPTAHATTHETGGTDVIPLDTLGAPTDIVALNASLAAHGLMQKYPGGTTNFLRADGTFATPATGTPGPHATTHEAGGSDVIPLDTLGAPTDITTLNATTAAHGLMQKYPGGTANFLRADGTFGAPNGGTPAAHKTTHQSGGSDSIPLDTLAAPTDITTLNATTSAHGLMQKYPGGTTNFLRADGTFAAPPSGGSGSPAGATGNVQYNNAGAFGAEAPLTYDFTNHKLTVPSLIVSNVISLTSFTSYAISGKNNDLVLSGSDTVGVIGLTLSALSIITGLTAPASGGGTLKTIINLSDTSPVIFTHEDVASSALNRFKFGLPLLCYVLCPGETITILYDVSIGRWRVFSGIHGSAVGSNFGVFDDFLADPALTANQNGPVGAFGGVTAGSGSSIASTTLGVSAVENVVGAIALSTGGAATGRAAIHGSGTSCVVLGNGAHLFLVRLTFDNLSDATNKYESYNGLHNADVLAQPTRGAYWSYLPTTSPNWIITAKSTVSGSNTSITTGIVATTGTYQVIGIWVNPLATVADFFYSPDGFTMSIAGSITTNIPGTSELLTPSCQIQKTASTSARALCIDYMGYRFLNSQR